MSDKILKFNEFTKGPGLNDPSKHALTTKVGPIKKEKVLDQVKRADLTISKISEPDYTKTTEVALKESSADTQAEIDVINQTKALRAQLATADTDEKRLTILNQIKQIQQQVEKKATTVKTV